MGVQEKQQKEECLGFDGFENEICIQIWNLTKLDKSLNRLSVGW